MTKRLVMSMQAQEDLTNLDRGVALRIAGAIQRFADTGAGNVKALHAMHPPEFRLRVGDWRVRFHDHGDWIDILRIMNRREGYR